MSCRPSGVWFGIAVASLIVIVVVGAGWDLEASIAGIAGVLAGIGISLYLLRLRERRLSRARRSSWLLPAISLFYAVAAVTMLASGGGRGLAAVAAVLIPLAAGALLLATTRPKTVDECMPRVRRRARRA